MKLTEKDKASFWSRVDTVCDCWEWTGCRNKNGYGIIGLKGKDLLAHRVAYTMTHGPIPPGMLVCHHCDNPGCCNPDHLFIGTQKDNMQDCARKGRRNIPDTVGDRNGRSKLTEKQVLEIRQRYTPGKYTLKVLAGEYGVGFTTIYKIIHRELWTHI